MDYGPFPVPRYDLFVAAYLVALATLLSWNFAEDLAQGDLQTWVMCLAVTALPAVFVAGAIRQLRVYRVEVRPRSIRVQPRLLGWRGAWRELAFGDRVEAAIREVRVERARRSGERPVLETTDGQRVPLIRGHHRGAEVHRAAVEHLEARLEELRGGVG